MADVPHYCSACGEVHGGHSGETEAVKIAKINRDADIEIARLQRSEARQEIEAEIEQTETVAAAEVEQTAIEAEAIVEVGAPPEEPGPPVVEAPMMVEAPAESVEEEVPAPPETEPSSPGKKSGGMWAGYR